MSQYPYHMRRRSRQPLSYAQDARFRAEQNERRLDELGDLIRAHLKHGGEDGFREIERLALDALDEIQGASRRDPAEAEAGSGMCSDCREELALYGRATCGCSRSSSWWEVTASRRLPV